MPCAIPRKSGLSSVILIVVMPFQGHEDWDFWLSVVASHEFCYLKEITFDYRVSKIL